VSEAPALAELAQATPSPEGSSMGPNEVRPPSAAPACALHGSAWSVGSSDASRSCLVRGAGDRRVDREDLRIRQRRGQVLAGWVLTAFLPPSAAHASGKVLVLDGVD